MFHTLLKIALNKLLDSQLRHPTVVIGHNPRDLQLSQILRDNEGCVSHNRTSFGSGKLVIKHNQFSKQLMLAIDLYQSPWSKGTESTKDYDLWIGVCFAPLEEAHNVKNGTHHGKTGNDFEPSCSFLITMNHVAMKATWKG